jgi:hypothetical protein
MWIETDLGTIVELGTNAQIEVRADEVSTGANVVQTTRHQGAWEVRILYRVSAKEHEEPLETAKGYLEIIKAALMSKQMLVKCVGITGRRP